MKYEFKQLKSGFVAILYRSTEKSDKKSDEKSDKKSDKIIEIISNNPTISYAEMAKAMSMSVSGVRRIVEKLKGKGRIDREGPDKGGRWVVNQD